MSTDAFRERARQEAERYGADPWVFVRELLQNARDAGAHRVWLTVQRGGDRDRVSCRDDGCGMSLEHARRFLFTLYASSKRGRRAAGRFGVGFWSVLRFEPDVITVRSRTASGDGWEVGLDGRLDAGEPTSCVMYPGTEVVLSRPAQGGHPLLMVLEAARRDARYLHRRDHPERSLEVTVNGRPITEELALPPPSLRFRRTGLRGAVALGSEARVDVLAHGLRVRSAAFLDELLLAGEITPPAVEMAEGLLPRIVLDSDRLEVLLARGDTRDDGSLRRAVAVAHGELRRLVRSELDRAAPLRGPRRWLETLGEAWRAGRALPLLAAALTGATLGVLLSLLVADPGRSGSPPRVIGSTTARAGAPSVGGDRPVPYHDLRAAYTGPAVDTLEDLRPVALTYRPATAAPWLAAMRLTDVTGEGGSETPPLGPYRGAPCASACLEVDLGIDAAAGPLRLPVATGHLVDPTSVRLDGAPVEVRVTPSGQPVVLLERAHRGVLSYRSGPAPGERAPVVGGVTPLPPELAAEAAGLLALPPADRVEAATRAVASRVVYARSPAVAERYRAAAAAGSGVLERALAIGAGDCDVQNAVLAALLQQVGLPSRLAVGFVGRNGGAVAGLHAWVEFLEDGVWRIADASAVALPGPPSTAASGAGAAAFPLEEHPSGEAPGPVPPAAPRLRGVATMAGVAAVVVALGWVVLWRRGRRVAASDRPAPGDGGMGPLLRAALLRPHAWSRVEAVYRRPLVPVWGRRPVSLRQALRLAGRGRLYRSDAGREVARAAAGRGSVVLDGRREEGRVVADLLGAVDLDCWEGVLEDAVRGPAVERVESALQRVGWRARLCVAASSPEPVAVLEGRPFGHGRRSWLVVVDGDSRLWTAVARSAARRPEWAALLLGDAISERAPAEPERRSRLLGHLARRALAELEVEG